MAKSGITQAQDAMKDQGPPAAGGNIEQMKNAFFDTCEKFGQNAGMGDTSKVGWFQATVEAAWQGIVVPPSTRRKKGDHMAPLSDPEQA